MNNKEQVDIENSVPILYPAGKYKISLNGRGVDRGFSKITKTQYDYWLDREELGDALNNDFDYEENKTPKKARFEYDYYEYTDQGFYSGPDDSCWIEIQDEDRNILLVQELSNYIMDINGEDKYFEHLYEEGEFYLAYDCKPGYYLYWIQGGKGTYFTTELQCDELFDPRKLIFNSTDVEGESIITKVFYGTEELENYGGDWSGKYADYKVIKVDKR